MLIKFGMNYPISVFPLFKISTISQNDDIINQVFKNVFFSLKIFYFIMKLFTLF